MFFEKTYKPIPLVYNLVLAMLWRHPENVELEKVKVVHYCAAVIKLITRQNYLHSSALEKSIQNAVRSIEFVLVDRVGAPSRTNAMLPTQHSGNNSL